MAKIKPSHIISSISGKLCGKETGYISYNKRTGKMHFVSPHEYGQQPNTELQQAVKATFTTKAQFASQWWSQNKPAAKGQPGSEAYQAIMKAYNAQCKIGNPYSYLRSLVSDDMKVILAGRDLTGGLVPGNTSTTPTDPEGQAPID